MKKIIIASILLVFLAAPFAFSQSPYSLTVWVDRGCGASYRVGEKITVFFDTNIYWPFQITIWERRPDGRRLRLLGNAMKTGCPCSYGYVIRDEIMGKRTIEVELYSHNPFLELTNLCDFNVAEETVQKGTLVILAKDQNGAPVPSVTVLLDGAEAGKTDASGLLSVSNVSSGNHTIDVFHGGAKYSRSVYVSGGTQSIDFLFAVVKEGVLSLNVADLAGISVPDVQVYVDGSLAGSTGSDGRFTVGIAAGDHAVLVRKSGKEKGITVSVTEGQTAHANVSLEIGGKVTYHVTDEEGMPLSGAQVFLDYVLVGTTDAQGMIEVETELGFHVVGAIKQGYEETVINPDIITGTVVEIVMSESVPYLLYGFIAVVFALLMIVVLLVLRRRKAMPPAPPVEKPTETKEEENASSNSGENGEPQPAESK